MTLTFPNSGGGGGTQTSGGAAGTMALSDRFAATDGSPGALGTGGAGAQELEANGNLAYFGPGEGE